MTNSKISTSEAIMLVLTIFVAHTLASMPRNLLLKTKSSTIINLIYIGILVLLITFVIYKLMKNFSSSDILDISDYLGGKTLKMIIGSLFIFYFIFNSSILIRNFCEGLKIVYYPLTDLIFILLTFIITTFITTKLEFATTAKINLIIIPIVLVSILCLFFGNIKNFSIENMYPILGEGPFDTFVLGLENLGAFGGIAMLYFLPPYLKEPKKMKKICMLSIGIAIIHIIICVATILFMFSFLIKVDEIMPLYSAARHIEFGSFFQRLDSIFLLIWIFQMACYLCICIQISMNLFKKMTNSQTIKPLSYIFGLLIIGICLSSKNYAISKYLENIIYNYLVFAIPFGVGISILILANLKKRKKEKVLKNE